jgi:hypothetical protein
LRLSSKALAWDAADRNIREALIKVLEKDDGPAGLYYKSCMDLDHIEQVGDKQLEPWIKFIDAIDDKASMVTAITEFNKHDMDTFFSWGLDTDNRDTTRKSFSLLQGGVSLPDNTYYLEDSAVMQGHREKYLDILAKYLAKIGRAATAEREAQMILDFETKFAGIRVDRYVCVHVRVVCVSCACRVLFLCVGVGLGVGVWGGVGVHIWAYICTRHAYLHTYIHTYIRIYIYLCIYMYVFVCCVCVCVCVCV